MTHRDFFEELIERIRSLVRTEARGSTPDASASILCGGVMSGADQILFRLQSLMPGIVSDIGSVPQKQELTGSAVELEACISAAEQVGEVNPRLPGFANDQIQFVKRLMRRSLGWYTRPLRLFHGAVIRALQQFLAVLEKQQRSLGECALQKDLLAMETRLDDVEQGTCQIYQLTQSIIDKSEVQARSTSDDLEALRADLRNLREEVALIRQQVKEAVAEY